MSARGAFLTPRVAHDLATKQSGCRGRGVRTLGPNLGLKSMRLLYGPAISRRVHERGNRCTGAPLSASIPEFRRAFVGAEL